MTRLNKATAVRKMKNASARGDITLRRFQNADLGDAVTAAGIATVVRPQRATSILLSDELKDALRRRVRDMTILAVLGPGLCRSTGVETNIL